MAPPTPLPTPQRPPTEPVPPPREIELKLFVPAAQVDRLWSSATIAAHADGPRRIARIANRYFDTPHRNVVHARMALRLRRIGRRWVQTLKTSGSDDETSSALSIRGEWEMPVAGPKLELARFAGTPLADLAPLRSLARRLQPLFATDFRREAQRLDLGDGMVVELVFDRGTIAVRRGRARRTMPICEVEIEIVAMPPSVDGRAAGNALLRFAARLAREVSLIPLPESKAARGYRLADNGYLAPARTVVPQPAAGVAARHHLARVLVACNAALLENVHALLEASDGGHADAYAASHRADCVHQARVAIRRLRSALHLFRSVVKGRRSDALDAEMKRIGAVFGAARDQDVIALQTMGRIAKAFRSDGSGPQAFDAIDRQLVERRTAAHRALTTELESGVFGAVTIDVERLAGRLLRDERKDHPLAEHAAAWLSRQYERVVVRSRRLAVLDRAARHGLRIEVKRLRYALDLLESLYDDTTARRFGDALAGLQKRLGRLNDETVALSILETLERDAAQLAATGRYAAWLDAQVEEQLPKIAARAVALELTPSPWSAQRSRAFG